MIALLPSEDQKFVAGPGDDHELLWWLLGGEYTHGGVDLDEGQLSLGGYESTQAEEQGASNHVFTGAWKVECGPSKIEIDLDGEIHEAELLELEDRPGWGTYHLDVQITEVPSHVITLYGPDGEVLDTVDHPEVREIPQMPDADAVGNAVEVADVDDLGHADVDG